MYYLLPSDLKSDLCPWPHVHGVRPAVLVFKRHTDGPPQPSTKPESPSQQHHVGHSKDLRGKKKKKKYFDCFWKYAECFQHQHGKPSSAPYRHFNTLPKHYVILVFMFTNTLIMYECDEGSPDDSKKKPNSQRAELHGQHLICPVPIYTRLLLCVSVMFLLLLLLSPVPMGQYALQC